MNWLKACRKRILRFFCCCSGRTSDSNLDLEGTRLRFIPMRLEKIVEEEEIEETEILLEETEDDASVDVNLTSIIGDVFDDLEDGNEDELVPDSADDEDKEEPKIIEEEVIQEPNIEEEKSEEEDKTDEKKKVDNITEEDIEKINHYLWMQRAEITEPLKPLNEVTGSTVRFSNLNYCTYETIKIPNPRKMPGVGCACKDICDTSCICYQAGVGCMDHCNCGIRKQCAICVENPFAGCVVFHPVVCGNKSAREDCWRTLQTSNYQYRKLQFMNEMREYNGQLFFDEADIPPHKPTKYDSADFLKPEDQKRLDLAIEKISKAD